MSGSFFRFHRVQLKQRWRGQLKSCPEPPSNLSAYLSPDPVQTMLTFLRCTNQNTSHYTAAAWEGPETEAEETRRKVAQREKGEEELPGLKHHVGLLLLKSQSHQMMCSLWWPPSRLLFSLLYCFHSRDSAGCTASTIQCPQTKSIDWDREGAPGGSGAPGPPEVQDTGAVGVKGIGVLAWRPLTLRSPCSSVTETFRLNLRSEVRQSPAPSERFSLLSFKLLQMFGESKHEAGRPWWLTTSKSF